MGVTWAFFQSCGKVPVINDLLKVMDNGSFVYREIFSACKTRIGTFNNKPGACLYITAN